MVMQCVLFKSDIYLQQVPHLRKAIEKKPVAAGEVLKTNLTFQMQRHALENARQ